MESRVYIPKDNIESFKKMVEKVRKHVPALNVVIGKEEDVLFRHPVFDGKNVDIEKVWHPVYNVFVDMPDEKGWRLLAYYKDGMAFVTDHQNKLTFKNPAHGINYGKCDVCGNRAEKSSYVVYNPTTGEELQVGCGCVKKFGLDNMEWIAKFYAELYQSFDCSGHGTDTFDDEPTWRGEKDPYAFSSVSKAALLAAAKVYYDNFSQVWVKGYRDNGYYVKSASNEKIQDILCYDSFMVNEEYVDKVCQYTMASTENNYSEFACDMRRVAENYYAKPMDACCAFFMVKNYEDSIKAKELGLDTLAVGMQVKVKGEIINIHSEEGFYGITTTYTIKTEKGFIVKRKGVVPTIEENGRKSSNKVEFYALIKFINKLDIFVDRALKHPKKGIAVTML